MVRSIFPNVPFEFFKLINDIFRHFHILCNFCNDKQKPGDTVLQLNNLFLNLVYRLAPRWLSVAKGDYWKVMVNVYLPRRSLSSQDPRQ